MSVYQADAAERHALAVRSHVAEAEALVDQLLSELVDAGEIERRIAEEIRVEHAKEEARRRDGTEAHASELFDRPSQSIAWSQVGESVDRSQRRHRFHS